MIFNLLPLIKIVSECIEVDNYNLIIELRKHYVNKDNSCLQEENESEAIVKYCNSVLCKVFGADGVVS
jgi:NADH:ubiquinone oxidoreductase subunit E